ncbi:MAG: DUF3656 domain-containing protein [Lacunisphaera sp.]
MRKSYEGDQIRFRRPLHLEVHGHAGSPLTLFARDADGHVARAESKVPLAIAQKQPLTTERLRDQLGRLGGTPFELGEFGNHLEGDIILAVSELNELRRSVVATSNASARNRNDGQWPKCGVRSADCGKLKPRCRRLSRRLSW